MIVGDEKVSPLATQLPWSHNLNLPRGGQTARGGPASVRTAREQKATGEDK